MKLKEALLSVWQTLRSCLIAVGMLMVPLALPIYFCGNLFYTETKGPFKNSMQVVDLEGDGDLDVIVSHTRWEQLDESWAGVGLWVNEGDGMFELLRAREGVDWPFLGHAAGAGDIDQDGDLDVLNQDFGIRLLLNQSSLHELEPGKFQASGEIGPPPAYNHGYRDMGGTITMGDLNGDGRTDAFVAGCCYGMNATEPGYDYPNAPSVSWVWINDGREKNLQTGDIIPLDFLDGRSIRQAALDDLDGDGDLDVFAAVGKPTMGTIDLLDNLILLNDGTGMLSAYDQPLGRTDSTSIALGDVNGDGQLDALVGTSVGARLWINQSNEMGSGGPMFGPTEQSFRAGWSLTGIVGRAISAAADKLLGVYLPYGSVRTKAVFLADLDGDGDKDILLARLWRAEIWWNDGDAEFSRLRMRFEYSEDTGLAVADFDGDGDQDIFAGGNEQNYKVWWNEGNGMFTLNNP